MAITSKDWIQLSAYIDGELSRREQDLLERKLKSDPQLQSALDQLQMARGVLRLTPTIKTPRNFTISPGMVSAGSKRPAFRSYRLAAALMSFVLIGVLIVDFGRFMLGGAMAPAAPRMEEVMLESAAKEAADTSQFDAEGEVSQDRIAAEPGADAPVEEIHVEEEAPAEMAEAEVSREVLGVGEEIEREEKASPDGDLQTTENLADEIEQPTPAEPLVPTSTLQPQATVEYNYLEDDYFRTPWYRRIPVFRIIELLLFVGVIGFATAAWVIKRRY